MIVIPTSKIKKGISIDNIRLLTIIFMTFYSIYNYFVFRYPVPIWLKYLGQIHLPLILLLIVETYSNIDKRIDFLANIYVAHLITNSMNYFISIYLYRMDDIFLNTDLFLLSFYLILFIFIFENIIHNYRNKNYAKMSLFSLALILPFAINIAYNGIENTLPRILRILIPGLIPMPLLLGENIKLLLIGIILYFFRDEPKKQAIFYLVTSLILFIPTKLTLLEFFRINTMWMIIFATPIIYFYNKDTYIRGEMDAYLPLYYVLHKYCLYFISSII